MHFHIYIAASFECIKVQKSLRAIKLHSPGEMETKLINFLLNHQNVSINWVPAHENIWPNELADRTAKDSINCDIPPSDLGIYVKPTIKNYLRRRSIKLWQQNWENSEKGRFTYEIVKDVSKNVNIRPPNVNRIISGHFAFSDYLHRFNLAETPDCFYCTEIESISHVLLECELYANIRTSFFGNDVTPTIQKAINDLYIRDCIQRRNEAREELL